MHFQLVEMAVRHQRSSFLDRGSLSPPLTIGKPQSIATPGGDLHHASAAQSSLLTAEPCRCDSACPLGFCGGHRLVGPVGESSGIP